MIAAAPPHRCAMAALAAASLPAGLTIAPCSIGWRMSPPGRPKGESIERSEKVA
jgi:hypothetical protein